MSTKIYNGFCVDAGSTASSLTVLGQIRPSVQKLVDAKQAKLVASRIASKADTYSLLRHQGEPLPTKWAECTDSSIWWTVVDALHKEQRACRASYERSPLIDCDVELTLYLHAATGRILGYLQEERVGVYDHLVATPGVFEFGYWNNTDQPDGVSEEDWEQRAQQWNDVLDDAQAARFSMRWEPGLEEREAVLAALPSFEERVNEKARNILLHKHLEAHRLAHPEEQKSASFSGVMRVVRTVEEGMATPGSELHNALEQEIQRVTPLLVQDLGKHVFSDFGKLPGLPAEAVSATS